MSEYARRVLMDRKVPESRVDAEAIDTMRKVNADQTRLGILLRDEFDALGASRVSPAFMDSVERLHDEIREIQGMIRAGVLKNSRREGQSGPNAVVRPLV